MSDIDKNQRTTSHSIEDGIAGRIKAARESMGFSQTDLHKITGLSRMVISKYESGQNKPGTRELRLLCDALEISPNHLIYGTESPHKPPENIAETLLSMGQQGIAASTMIIPIIGSIIGTDDTRAILNLVESLLKAKNPEEHAMIVELIKVFKDSIIPNKVALLDPNKSEEAKENLQKVMKERLLAAAIKKMNDS